MATECVIMMKFGLQTVGVNVESEFSYNDLVSSCLARWREIDIDSVGFKYSIEGHPNCFLTCQADLVAMLKLFKLLKVPQINVEVVTKDCNVGSNVFVDKEQCVSSSVSDHFVGSSSADLSLDVGDEMIQASSCKGNEEVLLSLGWASCISHVGQGFPGGAVKFRIELAKYALVIGFKFDYVRNNKTKVIANCSKRKSHGCRWCVVASFSVVNNWFYIEELNNVHTCCPSPSFDKSSLLTASVMADLIIDQIRVNPTTSAKFVEEMFLKSYGLIVNYMKCWRALERARGFIFGRYEESFQELQWYCEAVRSTNVGSFVDLSVDPTNNRFKRMFVAFGASISGFNHCRPMLFIGGTFLKSRYKGTLLVATGKDADDGLYPLAFAVVDAETGDNWIWFLRHLRTILDPDRRITIISDRGCGLVEAISAAFGESADHFYCLEHLKRDLRSQFSGKGFMSKQREKIVDMFSECAYAPSVAIFNEKVAALKEAGGAVVDKFVSSLPVDKWNNAHGPRNRYGEMYSNPTESFNSWVSDVSGLPIMYVFETIRVKLMGWFNDRRTQSLNWSGVLCPKKAEVLTSHMNDSSTWNVGHSIGYVYNVCSYPSVTVDLDLHTCTCQLWQVYGFPCVHALAALRRSDRGVADIVESFFHVSSYRSCYAGAIASVPTMLRQEIIQQIEDGEILPPETRRQTGHPKKRKIKCKGEKTRKARKCGRCGGTDGHNNASCEEAVTC